jgi:hypothetical protein
MPPIAEKPLKPGEQKWQPEEKPQNTMHVPEHRRFPCMTWGRKTTETQIIELAGLGPVHSVQ